MDLHEAQDQFEDLVSKVSSDDLSQFFNWIQRKYLVSECLGEKPAIAYSTLTSIANDIKELIPSSGLLSSETIFYPSDGENSDCNPCNTVSVDAFLYDDMDVEELVESKRLSRNYCLDCNSKNTKPLNFISHSASKLRISFIFSRFLKDFDFTDKTIVDIGSRFGAIVFGAYVYTNAPKIIGIEMNEELCALQNTIVNKYQMNDRIEIKCGNVCDFPQLINSCDLIVLNNVFEFFQDRDKQVKCWQFLRKNIKSGTCLVTVPSLQQSLKDVSQTEFIDLSKWVLKEDVREPLLAMSIEDLEELSEICVYRVI